MKFELGTISHGTLRPQDIAAALLAEFDEILDKHQIADLSCIAYYDEDSDEMDDDKQEARDLLENWPEIFADVCDTIEAHEDFPPFCYLGAHEGDGADLGIWISWDAIGEAEHCGEVVRISDLSDIDDMSRDDIAEAEWFLLINDHGNATLYPVAIAAGEEAWSVV